MANEMKRFWEKVEKTDGCWEWRATINTWGYGQFWAHGRITGAHRFSWQLVHGPIEKGMDLDHVCHNKSCVNPSHLRVATRKQNSENERGPQSNSKSGILGVTWRRSTNKWEANVRHNGRLHYAGAFKNIEDAAGAVIAKRNELFTHNDRDRSALTMPDRIAA